MESYYKNGKEFKSQQAIRNDNPNTSLPRFLTEQMILDLGYLKVVDSVKPTCTEVQYVADNGIDDTSGTPIRQWIVKDMFADTPSYTDIDGTVIPAMTKLEHETSYLNNKASEASSSMIEHYKSIYLSIVDAKLKALDYDSLATVKLWEGDANFGAEASQILTWYKNIINLNYAILNAINTSTKYNPSWVNIIPTDAEYEAEINGVVF